MSPSGQLHALPRRSIAVRFTSINGHQRDWRPSIGTLMDGIPGQLVGGESNPGLALTGGSGHAKDGNASVASPGQAQTVLRTRVDRRTRRGVNGSAQRRGALDDDLAIGVEDRRRQNA